MKKILVNNKIIKNIPKHGSLVTIKTTDENGIITIKQYHKSEKRIIVNKK
jgi:hypothetical protein